MGKGASRSYELRNEGEGQRIAILAAVAAMVSVLQPITALSQTVPADQRTAVAPAAGSRSYSIPAGPLTQALNRFADASQLQLIYSSEATRGVQASGLNGVYTRQQALGQLLAGSGLNYRFTSANTVTIERPGPTAAAAAADGAILLDTIDVQGESAYGPVDGIVATRSATGSKTDTPIIEIPQTINVVTADQIRAQGAQSVSEALRYTPGVRAEGYGANSPFDVYTTVRGFRSDLYLDGLRGSRGSADGLSSVVVDPWMLERVEVLKGPASGLYGQSGPGGLVNMVSKRPTDTPVREVQLQAGSFDRLQGAFDFGGALDEQKQFLFRITGIARNSGTQVDYVEDNRLAIAPALTWRPTQDTSLTLLASHQQENGIWSFYNYMPAKGSLVPFEGRRIPTDRFMGEPDFNTLDREQNSVGYSFDHRFNSNLAFIQNLRFSETDFYTRGAVTGRYGMNVDGTINRDSIGISTDSSVFAVDNQVRFDFQTGPLQHNTLWGLDYRRELTDYRFGVGAAPALDVFDPVYGLPVSKPSFTLESYESTQKQLGIYAQDQIKFGGWIVTLGGRYDQADSDMQTRNAGLSVAGQSEQNDDAFTGRAGLGYVFENGIAPYLSYATSFQPEIGIDAVTNQAFKPSTGQQFEAGVKYQPPGAKTLLTLAVFDLTQQNFVTFDDAFLKRQIGEVHVKGVEIEGKTEVTPNFDLLFAYAYLQTEITQSANPVEVGFELFSTPNHQASVWGDYKFISGAAAGLTLGAGIRYLGSTVDSTNKVHVPGVTLVDARVQYDLARLSPSLAGAKVSLNANNLFDETYVSQCDGKLMCTYGNRRTVLATFNYQW